MASNPGSTGAGARVLAAEFIKAAKQAPAIYFAPLRGAVNGVLGQWRRCQTEVIPAAS